MKAGLIRLLVAGMVLVGMTAMAADSGKSDKATKATGTVAAYAGAEKDVVAVLSVAKSGETFNLMAKDAGVVSKIKEAITAKSTITVMGTAVAGAKAQTIAVTKVEVEKPAKK